MSHKQEKKQCILSTKSVEMEADGEAEEAARREPAQPAEGGADKRSCPNCGDALPIDAPANQKWCSSRCRYDATYQRRKDNPERVARVRRICRDWKRKRKGHTPDPRLYAALPLPNPLDVILTDLEFEPRLRWPIELRHTRLLHGMLTALTGPHEGVPKWSLAPAPNNRWRVIWLDTNAGRRLAGHRKTEQIADQEIDAIFGPAKKFRPPDIQPERGMRNIRLRTITPVMIRSRQADGSVIVRDEIGPHLLTTLAQNVATKSGVDVLEDELVIQNLAEHTHTTRVPQGGKYQGSWTGLKGHLDLRCNAVAHSLLALSCIVGLGGRTAFGLGRVWIELET